MRDFGRMTKSLATRGFGAQVGSGEVGVKMTDFGTWVERSRFVRRDGVLQGPSMVCTNIEQNSLSDLVLLFVIAFIVLRVVVFDTKPTETKDFSLKTSATVLT